MSEVIDCLKVLKLHGRAQPYTELLERGGSAALQASRWLADGTIAHAMHSLCYAARSIGTWPAPGSAFHEARVLEFATLAFVEGESVPKCLLEATTGSAKDPFRFSSRRAGPF